MNKRREPTVEQSGARSELLRIAGEHPEALVMVRDSITIDDDGALVVAIALPTGDIPAVDGGLRARHSEEVVVSIPASYPIVPPMASVEHARFAGSPHVLQGTRICVYLDPTREWHPAAGMAGFLDDLWLWFDNAVNARFDASTALYHAVGGVLHRTPGTPTVVVRDDLPTAPDKSTAYLQSRNEHRIDLLWTRRDGALRAPLVRLGGSLRFGIGRSLSDLLAAIAGLGHPPVGAVLSRFAVALSKNAMNEPLYFVLAVPGVPGHAPHLLTGRIPTTHISALRSAVRPDGITQTLDPRLLPDDVPVEWCAMSDERPEISTRRDAGRPVEAFAGLHVHVWGCGGIGSWVAEFIARAGARRVTLCDPGVVHGGLLVRQNFRETDLGTPKVEALAERIRAISDAIEVDVVHGPLPAAPLPECDVLIDATVSLSIGSILDTAIRASGHNRPIVAQMATDIRTGTLGLLTVSVPGTTVGPESIDNAARHRVLDDGALEAFHALWQPARRGDELIPARGCSAPTFRGSAADVAGVAASLTSLLAQHIGTDVSGTHLTSSPHSPVGPSHHFIQWESSLGLDSPESLAQERVRRADDVVGPTYG